MASERLALISVSDKTGLLELARGLIEKGLKITASGGKSISNALIKLNQILIITYINI